MKFILFIFLYFCLVIFVDGARNRGRNKGKNVYVPSIIFPDIIPLSPRFLVPLNSQNDQAAPAKSPYFLEKNSTDFQSKPSLTAAINTTTESVKLKENLTEAPINNTSNMNPQSTKINRSTHAYGSFHLLESMAYIKKETLMPQLLVCLGLFSIVIIVMCLVQYFFHKKLQREKDFQRVLKMAINNENC